MVTEARADQRKMLKLVTDVRRIPRGYVLARIIRCHDGALVPVFEQTPPPAPPHFQRTKMERGVTHPCEGGENPKEKRQ